MKDNLTGNFELIREMNTALILRTIWKKAPVSRTEVVKITNLTGATVSRIVNKLITRGFIQEVGYGKSQGGRKPVLLDLNSKAVLVIGIDIEVDETIGVLMDLNGNILSKDSISNIDGYGREKILNNVEKIIKKILNKSEEENKVIGIGVGMHGLVDYYNGISIYPPAFGWENVPVAKIIREKFDLPTILENNDRALALGENWFGIAKNMRNFVCLKVGSGIGSGIYTNGKIYRGVSNSAGEIGHTTVDEEGELCHCGNYGCLESMASIPAIIKKTQKLLKQGAESSMYGMVNGNLEELTSDTIFEAAREGDSIATQVLRDEGRYLGIGIANTINMLNPEAVILGGKIMKAKEIVLESIRNTVKNRALSHPVEHLQIVPGALGENGVAIGAGTLILEKIFKFNRYNLLDEMPLNRIEL